MKVLAVIPARWNSSRFPGKPIALIKGKPMIYLVWKQVIKSKSITDCIVATDDKRISNICKKMDIKVMITSKKHLTGTDRLYEVSKRIKSDIYVNIQGDEPLINPKSIDKIIISLKKNLARGYCVCQAYATENGLKQDKKNSIGFIALSSLNDILYASRSIIPFNYDKKKIKLYRTVGLFAFTKKILKKFSRLKSDLEKKEKLEILRFLENNIKVKGVFVKERIADVNYPSDINRIEKLLKR